MAVRTWFCKACQTHSFTAIEYPKCETCGRRLANPATERSKEAKRKVRAWAKIAKASQILQSGPIENRAERRKAAAARRKGRND